ncbi:hypothetical protein FRC01_008077 [Tulasnella sp. 417]|nr:hypothetical protein FRC01_008077 [Tulasnella sp. 417]
MLVSASKLLALLALVTSAIAAPQASVSTSSAEPSRSTKIRTTEVPSASPATTSTPLLYTLSQTGGIATEVTEVTVFNSFISGSRQAVTTSIVETITLYPENVTHSTPSATPAVASATPAVAVSASSGATTAAAAPTTATKNGALPRNGGGMGLAAIAVVAGVVAAAV